MSGRTDGELKKAILKKKRLRKKRQTDIFLRSLVAIGLVALLFNATTTDWPSIKHVDVRGEVRLTEDEVISLAALDDTSKMWVPFVRRERIRNALEKNPLIDRAEVNITGPFSLRIEITERRAVGALEINGSHLAFDRAGDLIEIHSPFETYFGQDVTNIPPGLLRVGGVPLYEQSDAWALQSKNGRPLTDSSDIAELEMRFARMIRLMQYISAYGGKYRETFDQVSVEDDGSFKVCYSDRPPILLGHFDYPERQFRRMLAVLGDERFADTDKIVSIDLSSLIFPHFNVCESYFTPVERRAIETWLAEIADDAPLVADAAGDAEPGEDDTSGVQEYDSDIFDLAGEVD
jgi:hypothetical protein